MFAAVVAHARYGHPLRFYITPHCPQCPPVAALKLRLVPVTASRPSGEGNRRYAKWPSLESVEQPSALPGRWHALRAAVCAPLWLSWHRGIGQALRALWSVSGLRPVMWCVPPPTLVLRRCAASALRAGLPVRPPWGLPQPARLGCRFCYIFSSCSRTEYGGYRPKRPVNQRDRWFTSCLLSRQPAKRRCPLSAVAMLQVSWRRGKIQNNRALSWPNKPKPSPAR